MTRHGGAVGCPGHGRQRRCRSYPPAMQGLDRGWERGYVERNQFLHTHPAPPRSLARCPHPPGGGEKEGSGWWGPFRLWESTSHSGARGGCCPACASPASPSLPVLMCCGTCMGDSPLPATPPAMEGCGGLVLKAPSVALQSLGDQEVSPRWKQPPPPPQFV